MDQKSGKAVFDNNGEKIEINILNGNCKLQWKVDWAMRWFTFDVDFEMYGKDLTESAILSNKICKLLEKILLMDLLMNFFLDEKGEKISNQREMEYQLNNGLDMLHQKAYLYICIQIQEEQKNFIQRLFLKLLMNILTLIEKYPTKEKDKIQNPVWHVHNGKPPQEKIVMPFSMLLNLVGSSNANNKDILWKFINRFHQRDKTKRPS